MFPFCPLFAVIVLAIDIRAEYLVILLDILPTSSIIGLLRLLENGLCFIHCVLYCLTSFLAKNRNFFWSTSFNLNGKSSVSKTFLMLFWSLRFWLADFRVHIFWPCLEELLPGLLFQFLFLALLFIFLVRRFRAFRGTIMSLP